MTADRAEGHRLLHSRGRCVYRCAVIVQVVRHVRLLRGLFQTDPGLRDDHEGPQQRLPSRVLRLPALQPEVGTTPYIVAPN